MSVLEARQRITTDELVDEFGVSGETIRRDLIALEAKGLIQRVHGGAILPQAPSEEPFKKRMALQQLEKTAIAKAAVRHIQPGQSVFIDAGTTTIAFAWELCKVPNISVITNSYDIASILRNQNAELEVLLLGGRIISDVPGTYGELTLSEISRFQVDIAIMSPVALHPVHGAGSYAIHEAEVARTMIKHAQKLMILADQSKLNTSSHVQYCSCPEIDILVTNKSSTNENQVMLSEAGIKKIITAK